MSARNRNLLFRFSLPQAWIGVDRHDHSYGLCGKPVIILQHLLSRHQCLCECNELSLQGEQCNRHSGSYSLADPNDTRYSQIRAVTDRANSRISKMDLPDMFEC